MPIPPRYPLLTEMRLEQAYADRLKLILGRTATRLNQEIFGLYDAKGPKAITRIQLEAQRASIEALLRQDFSDIEKAIAQGQKAAGDSASRVISRYENELMKLIVKPQTLDALAAAEARRAASGIDSALQRMLGRSYTPLSEQVYKTGQIAQGFVDDKINEALLSGWDAKRLAKEISSSIDPNVPGGVSYAANRLARTEINNAFHAAAAKRMEESPFVDRVNWHLSSSHPEGDICDTFASEGPYPVKKVPKKPHPHCYCFITPELVSEEDFLDNLFDGKYDDDDSAAAKAVVKEGPDKFLDDAAIGKLDAKQTAAALSKRQDEIKKYADKLRAKQGPNFDLNDPLYVAQRKELNALFAREAALKKEAAQAKKFTHPKVDKLPKMAPPAKMEDAYRRGAANPNGRGFNPAAPLDYQINCTRVSYATEMRMRGYNINAAPAGDDANKSDSHIEANWIDKNGKNRKLKKAATPEAMMRDMAKDAPDGARFFVVGPWKRGGAHIWNAEKVNGEIIFHEAQVERAVSGTSDFTKSRLEALDFDKWKGTRAQPRWMRVDDMEPTDAGVTRGWVEIGGKIVKNPK